MLTAAATAETDETLAARAAGGCRASFGELIERHYDRIYRMAWRWSGQRDRAEDIAQDVCVKLASAVGGYRADAKFTTWLHRIAYTTMIDQRRISQRTVPVEPSEIIRLVDDGAQSQSAEEAITAADNARELWTAVRALPPQQRDAVLLIYGEDMSHAEAALIMTCSEKTVSWHVHEAKKKLKLSLKAAG